MAAPFKYTAEQIEVLFEKYKEYQKTNYFIKKVLNQKSGEIVEIELNRPPTVQGFCLFINIDRQTFYNIINKESENLDPMLFDIYTRVYDYIQENQLSGAILNEYNGQVVSRINGLSDTVNVQSNLTLNSLPLHINNNVIDLTESDYTILNANGNKAELKLSE